MTSTNEYEHSLRFLDLSLSIWQLLSEFYWFTHISPYTEPLNPLYTSDASHWSCFSGSYTPSSPQTMGEASMILHHTLIYWHPILTFAVFDVIFISIRRISSQYHLYILSWSWLFHLPYMFQLSTVFPSGWLTHCWDRHIHFSILHSKRQISTQKLLFLRDKDFYQHSNWLSFTLYREGIVFWTWSLQSYWWKCYFHYGGYRYKSFSRSTMLQQPTTVDRIIGYLQHMYK